jgi:endoglucanase
MKFVRFGLLRFAALLTLIVFSQAAVAQVQTARHYSMSSNTNGYYEYLPEGYNSSNESYPLILFVHGVGECGDGSPGSLPKVLQNGPPRLIQDGGFPKSFTVNGQTHKFIVISPQFVGWPGPADLDNVINYLVQNYRVNTSRIYLTGLSMGGGCVWEYAGANNTFAQRVAAIVPTCGASWPDQQRARVMASNNVPIWATHNDGDNTVTSWYTHEYINLINASPAPSPMAKKTIFSAGGHDSWSTTYSPWFKENNMNVYEWMLQYTRGGAAPANRAPVVSAGATQTLMPGTTSAQLNGSAYDPDGSVVSYKWSQYSGPTSSYISNTGIPNPVISNLSTGHYVFRLLATDNNGATGYNDVSVNVASPIPAKIKAASYSDMFGVRTETTADSDGGQNVGYVDNGDWMEYSVSAEVTGTYTLNLRLASQNTGGQLQIKKSDGTVLGTVSVPNTGGFQTWQTVPIGINVSSGLQNIRVVSTATPGWNINWLDFQSGATINPIPVAGTSIPAKIQAESFTAQSGTQNEYTNDEGGGHNVGYIENGDWMEYAINAPSAGTYNIGFRVAAQNAGGQLQVKNSSGTVLATVNLPQTGGYQTWQTVTGQVTLPLGAQTLRIVSSSSTNWNINWLDFTTGTTTSVTASSKIEAETYTAHNGTQNESTIDAGGGLNVGYIDNGDWMDYSVTTAAAGNYNLAFRIAAQHSGGQLQVKKADGTILTTVAVPQTGGYQTWTTVNAVVSLAGGTQTIRIASSASTNWNINWIEVSASTATVITSNRVEAEAFSNMSGIQKENTSDAGGGQNIGYVDNGDWMEYTITPATSGTYNVNLRMAMQDGGGLLQIRKADGTVLATVNVPHTGGYQTWATVSTQIQLAAGTQTIRLVSTSWQSWNLNWFEYAAGTATSTTTKSVMEAEVLAEEGFSIFPNPVQDRFALKVSNDLSGSMKVQIVNMSGAVQKQFNLTKPSAGTIQTYLSATGLSAGEYIITVDMQGWKQTLKLIKL